MDGMNGDDLPDVDYESIYGAEALEARRRAQFRALDAKIRELEHKLVEQARRIQLLEKEKPF